MFDLIRVFVIGKAFHPSLLFAGKARAYLSEAPFSFAMDKHSSLLQKMCKIRP